jgi:UDP-N-acetylglucosamine 4,6-dehydratase
VKYVILGATGTLGREIATRLLQKGDTRHVVCISRCELKQKQMASDFGQDPRLRFVLGDIRDPSSFATHLYGAHTVFHVAALKHIEVLEDNPEECIKTNIQGTLNVANAAIACRVPYVVFSSTDKAVDPINVYGMCKAISEKILLHKNVEQDTTLFSVYRWGNVVGSRGSAIHAFAKSLKEERTVRLTSPIMTRFWIRIEDAVSFILDTYQSGGRHEVMVPEMKASPVIQVISTIADLLGIDDFEVQDIGLRKGEKLHEVLRSQHHPMHVSSDSAPEYTRQELEDMIRPVLGLPGRLHEARA